MKADTSRSTIQVISTGFLLFYLMFSWQWAVFVSLIVGGAGITSAFLREKIEWAWMEIAQLLGYIIPHILLTLVFFVFLFPISRLSKIFIKDPLMLSREYRSYFIDRNKKVEKKSFENIW